MLVAVRMRFGVLVRMMVRFMGMSVMVPMIMTVLVRMIMGMVMIVIVIVRLIMIMLVNMVVTSPMVMMFVLVVMFQMNVEFYPGDATFGSRPIMQMVTLQG